MIEWFRAQLTARKLGLRDRGATNAPETEKGKCMIRAHSKCYTQTRIGIDTNGQVVEYCWRCECFLETGYTPPQPQKPYTVQDGSNVIQLNQPEKKN